MNKDVMAPALQNFCQGLHLVEAISMMHSQLTTPTHQQGSRAIDRIYMSRTLLKDAQGSFLSFGEVMHSDHYSVWIDIHAKQVGMACQEAVTWPAGQCLKCQDPCIVAKYNQELTQTILLHEWEAWVRNYMWQHSLMSGPTCILNNIMSWTWH